MRISFRVYGIPQTKGSTKAFFRSGMKYPVITNDNEKNKGWAATVSGEAQQARRTSGADAPFAGPICLRLSFRVKKPKAHPKHKFVYATKKPDLDKMIRSVKDALKGVLYRDDAQVVTLTAQKMYGDDPGVDIVVEDIDH